MALLFTEFLEDFKPFHVFPFSVLSLLLASLSLPAPILKIYFLFCPVIVLCVVFVKRC